MRRKGRDAGDEAVLPGYADLREIGGGAFATVFRAVEMETGRPVALKILKLDTIHSHLIETFHREIQALAAVSDHPNIVTLYRPSTTNDGRPVLVLELCKESLGQQLRVSGPMQADEVARIGIKIAGALETAHRNGFLHRDMKPQNILITQFGEPALADFGVAALQASAQMTAGVFGFTTLHAAPEVLEGHHLSPATDVYGLASTMYQLLTGQAPFATYDNEAPASVILRILRDPVRPLRGEHIPLGLADLLEASMAKEPEGRPRTAADFAAALRALERAQGWLETSFVAWGEAPDSDSRSAGNAPDPGRSARPAVGTEAGARSSLPPLLPPSGPPLAPLPPVRQSISTPDPVSRNVVQPVDAVRGRFGPGAVPPAAPAPPASRSSAVPPPAPASPASSASPPTYVPPPAPPASSASPPPAPPAPPASPSSYAPPPAPPAPRPIFVDPDPLSTRSEHSPPPPIASHAPPPQPRPAPRAAPPAGRPQPPSGGDSGPGRAVPVYAAWSVAAIAIAILVIIAAALMVAGVI